MKILADVTLPGLEDSFPSPFILSVYSNPIELAQQLAHQDILLCRSTLKVDKALLKSHSLRCIATASSGTDHLDHPFLKHQNIRVIDAKGSNATAVADYVIACIAYLDQKQLLKGNKAGIIGFGKVGTQVDARLKAADFQNVLFDPPKSERDPFFLTASLEELYDVDILCIHAELHHQQPYSSFNLIDRAFLAQLKPGCIIINASRGGIVNEEALLKSSPSLIYCTDVYLNEPKIDSRIVERSLICTPHIAGHSIEAKRSAVTMVSEQIHQMFGIPIPQRDQGAKNSGA